jgi:TrmH family RNA methyltransferase
VEIQAISTFKTNNSGVAVVNQKKQTIPSLVSENQLFLILDDIKDPGNLGTIIRLADW